MFIYLPAFTPCEYKVDPSNHLLQLCVLGSPIYYVRGSALVCYWGLVVSYAHIITASYLYHDSC